MRKRPSTARVVATSSNSAVTMLAVAKQQSNQPAIALAAAVHATVTMGAMLAALAAGAMSRLPRHRARNRLTGSLSSETERRPCCRRAFTFRLGVMKCPYQDLQQKRRSIGRVGIITQ